MPYKLSGKKVMVEKNGKWQLVKGGHHRTLGEAKRHLAALQINVEGKGHK